MAHAHDRTLIDKLGADPDHKTSNHDLACVYLQARAHELLLHYFRSTPQQVEIGNLHDFETDYRCPGKVLKALQLCPDCFFKTVATIPVLDTMVNLEARASLEVAVTKGRDQYRTHIGFIDLVLTGTTTFRRDYPNPLRISRGCHRSADHNTDELLFDPNVDPVMHVDGVRCGVEIKTSPTPLGDIIRQIKLYRDYSHIGCWILATTYNLPDTHITALRQEQIWLLRIKDDYRSVTLPEPRAVVEF